MARAAVETETPVVRQLAFYQICDSLMVVEEEWTTVDLSLSAMQFLIASEAHLLVMLKGRTYSNVIPKIRITSNLSTEELEPAANHDGIHYFFQEFLKPVQLTVQSVEVFFPASARDAERISDPRDVPVSIIEECSISLLEWRTCANENPS
jgi:hypothetical protein